MVFASSATGCDVQLVLNFLISEHSLVARLLSNARALVSFWSLAEFFVGSRSDARCNVHDVDFASARSFERSR